MSGRKRKQSDGDGKVKKVKKASGKTGKKKKKVDAIEDENPDLDIGRVMKPIGEYIKDREEMVNQMFWSLRGPKMNAMLPDLLKTIPQDELKALCLEQLDIMSKKRIRRILAGDDAEGISSSGTEEESSDDDTGKVKAKAMEADSQNQPADSTSQTDEGCGETIEGVVGSTQGDVEPSVEDANNGNDNPDAADSSCHSDADSMEDGEVDDGDDVVEPAGGGDSQNEGENPQHADEEVVEQGGDHSSDGELRGDNSQDDENAQDGPSDSEIIQQDNVDSKDSEIEAELNKMVALRPTTNKTTLSQNQMEILELEMRARAIKAMLLAQETKDGKPK